MARQRCYLACPARTWEGTIMKRLILITALAVLSGCASIVDGSSQSLSVKTANNGEDLPGSHCELSNNKGTWYVTTPGSVTIHRSYEDLNVKCEHDGYLATASTTSSSTKGVAFGNILFGGLIGTGVDMSTGAAYDYPSPIVVPLQPSKTAKSEHPTS
jgi:hypothetical protein